MPQGSDDGPTFEDWARHWAEQVFRLAAKMVDEGQHNAVARRHLEEASVALDKAGRHLMAAAGEEGWP